MMSIEDLAREFPRDAIHWRAQTLTRNGDKALALAYLDARDVMDRLDEVCTPAGWQDEYEETAKGRIICKIGIILPDVGWVWKSDGAGETAVEGEKGGISDAFKRAAVKWGIGRYLYRMDAVWCPCETYEKSGRKHWSKWRDDPWNYVRGAQPKPQQQPNKEVEKHDQKGDPEALKRAIIVYLRRQTTADELKFAWENDNLQRDFKSLPDRQRNDVQNFYDGSLEDLS